MRLCLWSHVREANLRSGAFGLLVASCAVLLGSSLPAQAQLIINPIWDSTITSDPNASLIEGTIDSAINVYKNDISTPITVNINFAEVTSGLGQSSTYYGTVGYSTYRSALAAVATSADQLSALASLPVQTDNPVNGNASMAVTTANLRALGFNANPPTGQPDSFIGLNTSIMNLTRTNIDPSKYDLMSVVSHEIDEALGFGSALNGLANGAAAPTGAVWGMDLYRYDQNGNRSFNTGVNTQSYFSIDGGAIDLARFNQEGGGDYSDWYSYYGGVTPQVQDAYSTPGATPNLGVELRGLNVLGYSLTNSVPEPGTGALLLFGLCVGIVRRRK
jgi:hypothetical protein